MEREVRVWEEGKGKGMDGERSKGVRTRKGKKRGWRGGG